MPNTVQVLTSWWRGIKQNGGILGALRTIWYTDDLKWGKLVGMDKFGNKYYENNFYFYVRNRWVIYDKRFGFNYDASQVPPEWHRWLHHTTDVPPTAENQVNYRWMVPHQENKSGTNEAYYPYSTTRTKIESWMPPHLRTAADEETPSKDFNVPRNNRKGVQAH